MQTIPADGPLHPHPEMLGFTMVYDAIDALSHWPWARESVMLVSHIIAGPRARHWFGRMRIGYEDDEVYEAPGPLTKRQIEAAIDGLDRDVWVMEDMALCDDQRRGPLVSVEAREATLKLADMADAARIWIEDGDYVPVAADTVVYDGGEDPRRRGRDEEDLVEFAGAPRPARYEWLKWKIWGKQDGFEGESEGALVATLQARIANGLRKVREAGLSTFQDPTACEKSEEDEKWVFV